MVKSFALHCYPCFRPGTCSTGKTDSMVLYTVLMHLSRVDILIWVSNLNFPYKKYFPNLSETQGRAKKISRIKGKNNVIMMENGRKTTPKVYPPTKRFPVSLFMLHSRSSKWIFLSLLPLFIELIPLSN